MDRQASSFQYDCPFPSASLALGQPSIARVFISYSREDYPFVKDLVRRLEAEGFRIWFDLTSLVPAADFSAEIRQAIEACDSVLIVAMIFSPGYQRWLPAYSVVLKWLIQWKE